MWSTLGFFVLTATGKLQNPNFVKWAEEKGKPICNETYWQWFAEQQKKSVQHSKNVERYVLSGAAQKMGKSSKQHRKTAETYEDEEWLDDEREQQGNFSDSSEPDEFAMNEKKIDDEEKN